MIYLRTKTDQAIIVLEPGNLERLKVGLPIKTPDKYVIIAYCPDLIWLSEQLEKSIKENGSVIDAEEFDALLEEGLKRPERDSGGATRRAI